MPPAPPSPFAQTAAHYRRAGIGEPVRRGTRPAVVVVDFCLGFTDPSSRIGACLEEELTATRRVLDTARRVRVPVLFTTIIFEPDESTAWLRKAPGFGDLRRGSRLVELDPRLGHEPGEPVLTKRGASAFFGTDLAARLIEHQVDTVLLCGTTTSGCVRASAVDALQYGYPTLVITECVGDRAPEPHQANLFDIQAKYGDVIDIEDALAYLDGGT